MILKAAKEYQKAVCEEKNNLGSEVKAEQAHALQMHKTAFSSLFFYSFLLYMFGLVLFFFLFIEGEMMFSFCSKEKKE